MERYFFRITIALITFFLGTGATLLWATLRAPDVSDFKYEEPSSPIMYGGVLNDKAIPPLPLWLHEGCPELDIHIVVDETGRVISASSDDIDPIGRLEAEKRAHGYRFTPVFVFGRPVKVAGTINDSACLKF